ncbi:MAG: hypothetical protein RLP14_06840 [Owenweeksia sp.]
MKLHQKLITILCLGVMGLLPGCEKETTPDYFEGSYECQKNETNRIGALCKDGSRSTSTGAGTCSRHGGVDVWLCK